MLNANEISQSKDQTVMFS